MDKEVEGKVMTVRGAIDPDKLGAVMMHEHLHADVQAVEERPTPPDRVELLRRYAVPNLEKLHKYGCHSYVDCSPIPFRAWPDVYQMVAEKANINIILSTGFYRELGKQEMESKYPFFTEPIYHEVRKQPVQVLSEILIREFEEGIHGFPVRPGIIKLGSTSSDLTEAERKAFRAGARAQVVTGMAITTHVYGAKTPEAQLDFLEKEGVNPERIILGHTGFHLVNEPAQVRRCMRRGATFLPTNLRMDIDWEFWQKLVDAIRSLFDEGYGDRLVLGLDWAFENEQGVFVGCSFMPPPPYVYLFEYTLPRFRKLGLEEEAIEQMLVENPKRILPIKKS